mmetsp:Transcript_15030/g.45398  ORF Transcript_15030/g.45398 Transcript_15030/m.45398 type:complete len:250 (+) Transcript_15030:265-1014(+)
MHMPHLLSSSGGCSTSRHLPPCTPQISTRPGSSPGQATRPIASPVAFSDPPAAPAEVALACLVAVLPKCSSPSPLSSTSRRSRQAGSAADTATADVEAADASDADSAKAPVGLRVLTAEAVYGDDTTPVPGCGWSLLASSAGPEADDEGAEEDEGSARDKGDAVASAAMRQKVYAPVQNAARCMLLVSKPSAGRSKKKNAPLRPWQMSTAPVAWAKQAMPNTLSPILKLLVGLLNAGFQLLSSPVISPA